MPKTGRYNPSLSFDKFVIFVYFIRLNKYFLYEYMLAVEMSKFLNTKITILISSAETKFELRRIYRLVGKLNLIQLIPRILFDPPRKVAHFLFGTKKTDLLNAILDDTDLKFSKWAVNQLLTWSNEERLHNCLKISGECDKLIPSVKGQKTIIIKRGEHFMIVDKAKRISEVINQKIKEIEY